MTSSSASRSAFHPDLREALVAMVRRRVPESEVEDIVQSTLADALESPHAPQESEALRRWIFGVAKNKVVDYHRRAGRETFELPEVPEAPAPYAEADLLRWAERNLPPGEDPHKTLEWMLREGDGEKLESIAASEKLPAPRVRQRVSRLRRHLKTHWAREVALLGALGVIVTIAVLVWNRQRPQPEPIANDPHTVPLDPRAEPVRRQALERCDKGEWKECLEGLDAAKSLDPAGDARPEVQRARQASDKALSPVTPPPPAPEPTTTQTMEPKRAPTAPPPSAFPMKAPLGKKSSLNMEPKPTTKPAPASTESLDSLDSVGTFPPSKSGGTSGGTPAQGGKPQKMKQSDSAK
jgi:DNA-directed RNA polymerase specialized sigma24 family protein